VRTLVLFTRDLRLVDHPALDEACRRSDDVVPLFVLDPRLVETSRNRARLLLEGLHDLDRRLRRRGGRLIVRHGVPAAVAFEVAREAACDAIAFTSDVTETSLRRERTLLATARSAGIEVRRFPGNSVVEPGAIAPAGRSAYRVFTPYHRAWLEAPKRAVLPEPRRIVVPESVDSDPIPEPASIPADASDLPPGGETSGRRQLVAFLRSDLEHYGDDRNDLAGDRTSRLSPYLRFGFVSANELTHRAADRPGGAPFVRQVAWRDFFRQLLAADPSLTTKDLKPGAPVEVPLLDLDDAVDRWRDGQTGLPLVDAGMRQLRREGWIHNRARLVVASFLTRRLGIAWQEGASHFMRFLVDGDPANNAGGWQWVAGTGTDTRPARAFNPVRQAQRFDPNGDYIRRYVPELREIDAPAIFAPWKQERLLDLTGYPEPLVAVPADERPARSTLPSTRACPRDRAGPPSGRHPSSSPAS
jgi:deoxyribodipyrimidine photo-lyase